MYRDRDEINKSEACGELSTFWKILACCRNLIQPHERIDLRQLLRKLFAVALGEATADHQLLTRPSTSLQNRFYGFLFRGLNETAGVHDEHVGVISIGRDLKALAMASPSMISASTRFLARQG